MHAPWEILARYADILNLQRPVKVNTGSVRKSKSNTRFNAAIITTPILNRIPIFELMPADRIVLCFNFFKI